MEVKEYREEIKRTLPDLGSPLLNAIHMVLGFVSETNEVIDAVENSDETNIGEELTDKLWYTFNLMNIYNINSIVELIIGLRTVRSTYSLANLDYTYWESRIANHIKREFAYGKSINIIDLTNDINNLLITINNSFILQGLDPKVYMQRNIDKLRVRFPEKFSTDKAITRDLNSERRALEGNV